MYCMKQKKGLGLFFYEFWHDKLYNLGYRTISSVIFVKTGWNKKSIVKPMFFIFDVQELSYNGWTYIFFVERVLIFITFLY